MDALICVECIRLVFREAALAAVETITGLAAPEIVHETAVFETVRRQGGTRTARMIAHRAVVGPPQIHRKGHRLVLVDGAVVAGAKRDGRLRAGGIDRYGVTDAVAVVPHRRHDGIKHHVRIDARIEGREALGVSFPVGETGRHGRRRSEIDVAHGDARRIGNIERRDAHRMRGF